MKKLLSLILSLTLLLSLAACGTAQEGSGQDAAAELGYELKDGQLLVGYGKVNITPEDSMPLGGFGNSDKRMSTGFQTYLFATCVAITDAEGNTTIMYGLDTGNTSNAMYETLRNSLSEGYGIPTSSIVFSASHMHSSPDLGQSKFTSIQRWIPVYAQLLKDAADIAMKDRAPADLYIASAETEGLNFVRRYKLEGDIYIGYQSDVDDYGLPIVGYETDADGELQLLKFDRGEEKSTVMLANFQTHPHRGDGNGNTLMNSNLVGAFRDEITDKLGYDVVYFSGASGNINPVSPIADHNITKDYFEQGKALAKYAIDVENAYEKVNGGKVQSITGRFEGKIDHSQDHMVAIAKEAQALWAQTNSIPAVRAAYLSYGINSPYHASAIISKASRGESEGFDVWAISIGDVGFAIAPYEMFDTNGMFIKENSPKKMTMVATCANGANGYFPSEFACEHGGYEPDTTKYVHGSAEVLANIYVDLLTQLN